MADDAGVVPADGRGDPDGPPATLGRRTAGDWIGIVGVAYAVIAIIALVGGAFGLF